MYRNIGFSLMLVAVFALQSCAQDAPYPGKGYHELNVVMDDGVSLATDIYIPKNKGRFPAILVRTPYNKDADKWMGGAFKWFNIVVVVQDVRGKHKSEGEFYPFANERDDGLATLAWIREQPWSNGVVGGWGSSYVGFTQWAISDKLDFLSPLLTGANLYEFVYPDGLFSLQTAFAWGLLNASPTLNTIPHEKVWSAMDILPLSAADDSTIFDIPFITDWLTHETEDDYWKGLNHRGITDAHVLNIAGWYDIFLQTQLADFEALVANGNSGSRMIVGPWCHGEQGVKNEYGGTKKTGNPRKVFMYAARSLKGRKPKLSSPFNSKTRYNLFIMERNEYVGADEWPPAKTLITPYYLGPENRLSSGLPDASGQYQYVYDPSDPFPSIGGTTLGDKGVGPALQNANLNRTDQQAFVTGTLEEPLILLGPISATLWLSSDVPCTDFMILLQDVFPDGNIVNIQEGGATVSCLGTDPVKHEIGVWATGYQLNPGHRLRVVITSSWYPRFNRNLNGCEPILEATQIQKANQVIHTGAATPSCIKLPVYKL